MNYLTVFVEHVSANTVIFFAIQLIQSLHFLLVEQNFRVHQIVHRIPGCGKTQIFRVAGHFF